MTWLVESFDVRTDELLAEIDLDALASDAVERLIGAIPEALAPDQVRVVAPLFDIDPEQWGRSCNRPSLSGHRTPTGSRSRWSDW